MIDNELEWKIHKRAVTNGCLSSYYLEPYRRKYICDRDEDCIIDCSDIHAEMSL